MTGPEKQTYNPRPRTSPKNRSARHTRPTEVKRLLGLAKSQCTYRCMVLPDLDLYVEIELDELVSMHLQVRGAP